MQVSRRSLLAGAAATAAFAALPARPAFAAARATPGPRRVGDRPYPNRPAGQPAAVGEDGYMPFEHVVVVMMENHSFDTYLGMLPLRGQPKADGFTFDGNGKPLNSNPLPANDPRYKGGGRVRAFAFHDERGLDESCQGGVTQSWNATHRQVNAGRMDGFVDANGDVPNDTAMGYYDEDDLPFYYSVAKTFALANRWFCSTQCQTYPNRRFLLAGTATGDISTDSGSLTAADMVPAMGTVMQQMDAAGVTWKNYFTDLPATQVILDVQQAATWLAEGKLAPMGSVLGSPGVPVPGTFFGDVALGQLPAVSFVDPEFGVTSDVGRDLDQGLMSGLSKIPGLTLPPSLGAKLDSTGGDEESPENVLLGQAFVASVMNAVMSGPAWDKTLLIWTYDEHGGYYDHVAPPAAPVPDGVPPALSSGDVKATYGSYGVRVPAVVISPWSRKNGVSDVVHDHTSILATIEKKWNLPALTQRDLNAATVEDLVDFSNAVFLDPPTLAPAQSVATAIADCTTTDDYVVTPFYPSAVTAGTGSSGTATGGAVGAPTVGSAAGDRRTAALAVTGLSTAVPVAGAALLAGAAALASARRAVDHADGDAGEGEA